MSLTIPAGFGAVSTKFAQQPVQDDLSAGIAASYGLIGYKGKVWSIRYRGDDTPLMRDDGDGPRGSIEVAILKASTQISKIWYEAGYVEGSSAAPDCFSNNGVTPEPTSAKKQCESCALCPHNQWGSRVTPAGKAGKSCSDSKRIAVAPLSDLLNEAHGGPMLLRVPAASLQDLASYGQKMQQMGYPYYAVGTRIGFDAAESYPKFTFGAIRPVTDAEADIILNHRDSHAVQRILSESEFGTAAPAVQTAGVNTTFEQPPQTEAVKPVQQQAAPKVEPVTAKAELSDEERELAEFRAMKAADKTRQEAETKAAAEAAAKAEAEAIAKRQAEEAAKAQPTEEVELSEEERELMEFRAEKARKAAAAAKKAEKDAAKAKAPEPEAQPEVKAEAAPEVTSEVTDDAKAEETRPNASAFEDELDNLLGNLGV